MMRLILKRLRQEHSGQALTELAISLPLLLLILLGGVELARICYASIEVTNAAHSALQYAVLNGGAFNSADSTGLDSTGMMRAATADNYDVSTTLQTPLSWSSGYPTYTCSCSGTGTASCTAPNPPTGCATSNVVTTVKVQMKTSFDPLIYVPLPGWGGRKITIYGYAQAKVLP